MPVITDKDARRREIEAVIAQGCGHSSLGFRRGCESFLPRGLDRTSLLLAPGEKGLSVTRHRIF